MEGNPGPAQKHLIAHPQIHHHQILRNRVQRLVSNVLRINGSVEIGVSALLMVYSEDHVEEHLIVWMLSRTFQTHHDLATHQSLLLDQYSSHNQKFLTAR